MKHKINRHRTVELSYQCDTRKYMSKRVRTDYVTGISLSDTLSVLSEESLGGGQVDRSLHSTVSNLHPFSKCA